MKKKSEKEHVRHFLHKTHNQEVARSFTLKSSKTTAKKCTKKVCCTCKFAFLLIRPIVVLFTVLVMSIYRARLTKWKQKREQEMEENGKRRAVVSSKFVSFQTVIRSGPGILSEAI